RVTTRVWETKGHRFRAWEQFALPREARRSNCDILHCAGMWCPYWQPLPTIVTIHDTLPWKEQIPGFYLRRFVPATYRRARRVITVSERSKRDILDLWPDLAPKVTVIRHGIR